MATVDYSVEPGLGDVQGGGTLVSWTLGDADDGAPIEWPMFPDRVFQVASGPTYGSATLVIEGSLNGVDYVTLTDLSGAALSFVSGTPLASITESCRFVRPRTSGGTGTSIQVLIYAPRAQ